LRLRLAFALPWHASLPGLPADREIWHPGRFAVVRLGRGTLCVQAAHHAIFKLVGVAQNVAVVKTQDLREIVHASHVSICNFRLDDVLPLPAHELAGEDAFQRRWPDIDRGAERLTVNRIAADGADA